MNKIINQNHIDHSYTYTQYKEKIQELANQGKTSGSDQSPEMIEYSKMNIHRMNRLDKTTIINDRLIHLLKNIKNKYYWVVLAEAWCGDAAQVLPVINKIAIENSNIMLKILFRDENPEIINDNLTNGTKSIPKLIILDMQFNKIITWGPRPKQLTEFVNNYKKRTDFNKEEMIKEIQVWYNNDNTYEIQNDFYEILEQL